jgi:hypothetical protein
VTPDDLRAVFAVERARFAARYRRCARATLTILRARCAPHQPDCRPRNVAWCYPSTGEVVVLERALRLSHNNLVALVRHELAHLADPSGDERATDRLAGAVGGRPIRYDRREIQTLAPRARYARRPARLPR